MKKPSRLTQEDVDLLKKMVEGKSDLEKLEFLFDWFVENWGYLGYPKFSHGRWYNSKAVQTPTSDPFDCMTYIDCSLLFSELGEQLNYEPVKKCENGSMEKAFAMVSWAQSFGDEQLEKLKKDHPKLVFAIENLLANVDYLKKGFQYEAEVNVARDIFLKKNDAKYASLCGAFASEYARVCSQIGLKNYVVKTCEGKIFNGIIWVGHGFNAIVNTKTNEVRYVDISFGIHTKEQKMGWKYDDTNCDSPRGFYMKTREEIAESEGRERKYYKTDQDIIKEATKQAFVA